MCSDEFKRRLGFSFIEFSTTIKSLSCSTAFGFLLSVGIFGSKNVWKGIKALDQSFGEWWPY